jgi:hypothetical protein
MASGGPADHVVVDVEVGDDVGDVMPTWWNGSTFAA